MIVGSDIVRYIFSAGGVTVLLLVTAIWLRVRMRTSRTRTVVFWSAIVFGIASIYAVDHLVGLALVGRLQPFSAGEATRGPRTAIVVLGSGSITEEDWDGRAFSVPDRSGVARVTEAARVFRLTQAEVVISSGGMPHPGGLDAPSGETMRAALIQLGVPPGRIVVETESRTTHDEAVIIAPMLHDLRIERVVLVTSDIHMRRSLGTFRAAGVDATPAIARGIYELNDWTDWLIPTRYGLNAAAAVVHELLGIAYYRLRGWYR